MPYEKAILAALKKFADGVTAKMTTLTAGEPEDQLRGPFDAFMQEVGQALAQKVVCTGETKLAGRLGKPDFAVHSNDLLVGYVELKTPGVGANPNRFTGHNAQQWKRFKAIPNLIYCDGNEWALYRSGKREWRLVRLSGDVASDGRKAVEEEDARRLLALLTDFLSWSPIIPTDRKGKLDLKGFAGMLAPLCRMLRDDVADALKDPQSPLVELAKDWRQLLFPDANDGQFADAYAQTVSFALLLARSEGAEPLTLAEAEKALAAKHSLLARALQVLTDAHAQAEISASLRLLIRVIAEVAPGGMEKAYQRRFWLFTGPKEAWLYFYEDFLAASDPKLRKDAGAYYTPVEVVRAQVRLIDDLLTNRLGMALGFADPGVVTLDPAAGTGTYLLAVIEHALGKVAAQQGKGAVPGKATDLARNIYGFEIMVGPFAVTELRVSRALRDRGATLPADGTHVYLTDTLESPHAAPPQVPMFLQPIAEQQGKALKVKATVPVIVCLGNPPYDRHEAADQANKARTGGWVRYGDENDPSPAILEDFRRPAAKPLRDIPANCPVPPIVRYGYRSFDRQYVIADPRLIDRWGPPLWSSDGETQVYLATLLSQPLSTGPATTVSAAIPDRDFFRGSYGARLMPLYRDGEGKEANILPGLLDGQLFQRPVVSSLGRGCASGAGVCVAGVHVADHRRPVAQLYRSRTTPRPRRGRHRPDGRA